VSGIEDVPGPPVEWSQRVLWCRVVQENVALREQLDRQHKAMEGQFETALEGAEARQGSDLLPNRPTKGD
jgi:hypothetical protein